MTGNVWIEKHYTSLLQINMKVNVKQSPLDCELEVPWTSTACLDHSHRSQYCTGTLLAGYGTVMVSTVSTTFITANLKHEIPIDQSHIFKKLRGKA